MSDLRLSDFSNKALIVATISCWKFIQNLSVESSEGLPMSSDFVARKRRILQLIDVPEEDYKDLSPIGAIDPGIRQLVHQINALDGFVTTSSCAGRIAVYSEVQRGPGTIDTAAPEELAASIQVTSEGPSKSGKGGGEWLYVSHEPVKKLGKSSDGELATMLGFSADNILGPAARSASPGGLVRFKFEPFVSEPAQSKVAARALPRGIVPKWVALPDCEIARC